MQNLVAPTLKIELWILNPLSIYVYIFVCKKCVFSHSYASMRFLHLKCIYVFIVPLIRMRWPYGQITSYHAIDEQHSDAAMNTCMYASRIRDWRPRSRIKTTIYLQRRTIIPIHAHVSTYTYDIYNQHPHDDSILLNIHLNLPRLCEMCTQCTLCQLNSTWMEGFECICMSWGVVPDLTVTPDCLCGDHVSLDKLLR